ncbi:hypothetical protein [uncultured Paraglaciecola sp.]|uniref:hypothetical protein n=1 Tax=uncultured Paraglaciecola sp. TaxID=1765024 RepID=UPI0026186EF9|nr:hypothetical protein [uncultured Paraglaciecola sp.]
MDTTDTTNTTELAESGYTVAVDNALDNLIAEPDAEAPETEPAEEETAESIETAQTEPEEVNDPTDVEESQAITLDESELDTEILLGDEAVTIRAMRDAYENRNAPEVLHSERQELESMRAQIEQDRQEFDYVQLESKPHEFFEATVNKMIDAGTLPKEAHGVIANAFHQLIEAKLYDSNAAVAKAQAIEERNAIQKQQQDLERKSRELQTDREIAQIERDYGNASPEVLQKLVNFISDTYNRTGELLSLPDAAAKNKVLFNKPAPSKRSLANRLRSSTPQTPAPRVVSSAEALDDLYNSK